MVFPTHGSEFHERQSWKVPCRAATTANITIATALNAGDVLDGVTLAAGDRVLVMDQTAPEENGIYVVGASPARAIDFASSVEIVGAAVIVTEGTVNGGKAWLCDTPAPITVGTDPITFTGFGTGGGSSIAVELLDASGVVTGIAILRADSFTDNGGGDVSLFPQLIGSGGGVIDFNGHIRILDDPVTPTTGLDLILGSPAFFAEHTPGALADAGLLFEAGTDYVGFYISEKDATTVQLYAWDSGGFDVELVDRGGHFWKHVTAAGDESIPSLGILRKLSAAPGSPVEGESYYDDVLKKTRTWDGTSWNDHW